MKVVQINATCGKGSTGRICVDISKCLTESGIENYIFYSYHKSDYPFGMQYAGKHYIKAEAIRSHISGMYGFTSELATRRLIRELDQLSPDIVHLHNLHGHNCNLPLLIQYLKEKRCKVFWTFHDCWVFTAYCPYYSFVNCEKWKTGCHDCPLFRGHSLFLDRSKTLYQKKKQLLSDFDFTIVTPSVWLADEANASFLKGHTTKVINNGIDLSVFRPTPSDFRKKHGIPDDAFMLLGVADVWGIRKGLDIFLELAALLDPKLYRIVLVGTNDEVDRQLPDCITSIHHTQDVTELAEIYTAADLFVNPTKEETFGLVNVEALACGTPVVMFRSGGSPECIDSSCGVVTQRNNTQEMKQAITNIQKTHPFSAENCIARAAHFSATDKSKEYLKLYLEET